MSEEGDRYITAEEIEAWTTELASLTGEVAYKKARIKFLERKLWAVEIIRKALENDAEAAASCGRNRKK